MKFQAKAVADDSESTKGIIHLAKAIVGEPDRVNLLDLHGCRAGDFGIADLIGIETE